MIKLKFSGEFLSVGVINVNNWNYISLETAKSLTDNKVYRIYQTKDSFGDNRYFFVAEDGSYWMTGQECSHINSISELCGKNIYAMRTNKSFFEIMVSS